MQTRYHTDASITTDKAVSIPRKASTTLEIEPDNSLSIACISAENRDVIAPDEVTLKNDIFAQITLANKDE